MLVAEEWQVGWQIERDALLVCGVLVVADRKLHRAIQQQKEDSKQLRTLKELCDFDVFGTQFTIRWHCVWQTDQTTELSTVYIL